MTFQAQIFLKRSPHYTIDITFLGQTIFCERYYTWYTASKYHSPGLLVTFQAQIFLNRNPHYTIDITFLGQPIFCERYYTWFTVSKFHSPGLLVDLPSTDILEKESSLYNRPYLPRTAHHVVREITPGSQFPSFKVQAFWLTFQAQIFLKRNPHYTIDHTFLGQPIIL
jgi:hypothetical protein